MNPRGVPPQFFFFPCGPVPFGLVAVCVVGGGPPVCCAWQAAAARGSSIGGAVIVQQSGVGFYELSLDLVVFVHYLVPPFWEHLRILVRHSCYSYVQVVVYV